MDDQISQHYKKPSVPWWIIKLLIEIISYIIIIIGNYRIRWVFWSSNNYSIFLLISPTFSPCTHAKCLTEEHTPISRIKSKIVIPIRVRTRTRWYISRSRYIQIFRTSIFRALSHVPIPFLLRRCITPGSIAQTELHQHYESFWIPWNKINIKNCLLF